MIRVLCAHGVTQEQISALTGKTQGRISEYMTGKRIPTFSTLEDFADGLGMPAVARHALGLAPDAAGSRPSDQAEGRSAGIVGASSGDVQPLLSNLSRASAVRVLSALREIHRGYVEADRLMGSICITGPISFRMPVIEKACEVTRGADRAEILRFACQFAEFSGWVFQDATDLVCAMHWTDRALDYAMVPG